MLGILQKNIKNTAFFSEYLYLFFSFSKNFKLSVTMNSEIVVDTCWINYFKVVYVLSKHTNFLFNRVSDIVVYDRPQYSLRYIVNYILSSPFRDLKIRVRLVTNKNNTIFSLTTLFLSLNWGEREMMDMFGVRFIGHNDLRRIIGDYSFWGFPGRKTFPLVGLYSLYYVFNFLRVFKVKGVLFDFWSIFFQKQLLQSVV